MEFAGQHYLRPYRSEWRVYNEDKKIVGTIDMVFEHHDGTVSIYDWKRTKRLDKNVGWGKRAKHGALKHIYDTNFWHYALQLNMYKTILEHKYEKKVTGLYLVCIHPDNVYKNYQRIEVPVLENEMRDLVELRRSQVTPPSIV
jgi:ATP-dependent exoDNAse (exonuclease V) beta subunit